MLATEVPHVDPQSNTNTYRGYEPTTVGAPGREASCVFVDLLWLMLPPSLELEASLTRVA